MRTRRHTFLLLVSEFGPVALIIGAGVGFCASALYAATIAYSEDHFWTMVTKGVLVVIACMIGLGVIGYIAERHLKKRGLLPPHYYD